MANHGEASAGTRVGAQQQTDNFPTIHEVFFLLSFCSRLSKKKVSDVRMTQTF
jgi:hypothetical protein